MKNLFKYILLIALVTTAWSCSEELKSNSVIKAAEERNSDFDKYLYREFTVPYNIRVQYWLDDKEIGNNDQVIPADIESSKIMAVLLKYLFLDVYNEASPEGVDFDRKYAVRIFQFVGSRAYNPNGTAVLGTAEGGLKITLNDLNRLGYFYKTGGIDPAVLLSVEAGEFHTIHHEFGHILHQTKNYSDEYGQISVSDYVLDSWSEYTLQEALDLGFITAYGRNNKDEDFVEMYSTYVTMSQSQWDTYISSASAAGKAKIAQKLTLLKDYLATSWGMDLNNIRAIILRRASEINSLDFVNLK